jgi:hypothetical protein
MRVSLACSYCPYALWDDDARAEKALTRSAFHPQEATLALAEEVDATVRWLTANEAVGEVVTQPGRSDSSARLSGEALLARQRHTDGLMAMLS